MSQPSPIDGILTDSTVARRRVVAEVRRALDRGRSPRMNRRQTAAGVDV